MNEAADPTEGIEPLLQAPMRLQIAAVLASVTEAEFARLKSITRASDSVLSKHLSALAEGGLIAVRKGARDGRQRTWASLTRAGRASYGRHLAALGALIAAAEVAIAAE